MTEPIDDDLPFEEALMELERTVRDLEDGRLGLDDALARYERGVGLIKSCHARLRQAEQRILLLGGVDDAGRPVLQPFQHEATTAIKADAARRVRRKPEETA
ncbi:MAG TPA: exodeoxyribonuclease VII small subunit [Gemmataceae bacterium]|nr:exodeoxyribonuclease VII small subunit [Gemmataceae bacterium]